MSEETPSAIPTSKQWMVPYFVFFQLHAGRTNPSRFISIRAIHNKRPEVDTNTGREKRKPEDTETLFNENVLISEIKSRWLGHDANGQPTKLGLYQELLNLNLSQSKPANIYFGVNPRLHRIGNKKEHVEGFVDLYLDMDGHRGYTKAQRWMQIQFLIDYGIAPSFIIDSGNGYHAHWILTRLLATVDGEELEKHMIALADCKAGGNVADVTRILRLPGFYNVKEWHTGNNPIAGVAYPTNFMDAMENKILLPRYEPEIFKHFPPCGMKDIAEYKRKALTIHPFEDAEFKHIMQEIVQEHGRLAKDQQARLAATVIQNEQAAVTDAKSTTFWQPTLKVVPPAEDIHWPKGRTWMKKYVRKGFDGLTAEEIEKIADAYGCKAADLSASELDAKIIYTLITLGYTHEALREFWLRPEYKLYRPDKEARSPTYFHDTYAKMLDSAQNAFSKGEAAITHAKKAGAPIVVDSFKTYAAKGIENSLDLMMNGEFLLRAIYEDLDCSEPKNQEWYDIEARVADPTKPDGFRSYPLLIPREAFNSLNRFKEHCYDRVTLTTDKASNLHRLLNHLLEKYGNVERMSFHTKITYQKGKFIFPAFTISKDGIEKGSIIKNNKNLQRKFFVWDWIKDTIAPEAEVQALIRAKWGKLLRLHMPRVVSAMFGIIGASAVRPRFEDEKNIDDFHIPTVNIRGDSHSGKSESVIILSSVTGIQKKKNVISTASSQFAIHRMMHVSNFVPLVIDEFKEEERNISNIEMIRDLVRRAYTGEAMIKGRADLSVDITHIHGALTIVGESDVERIGNIAEISRVLPITSSEFSTVQNFDNYLEMSQTDWTVVGPYFYQFVLRLNLDSEWSYFNKLKRETISAISDSFGDEKLRIGHNLAVLIYGCTVWDNFVQTFAGSGVSTLQGTVNPLHTLTNYMRAWALASGQNMRILIPDAKIPEGPATLTAAPVLALPEPGSATVNLPIPPLQHLVITRNELLDWIGTLNEMIMLKKSAMMYSEDHLIPLFKINKEKDELAIHFAAAYSAYADQCVLGRKFPIPKSKLTTQINTSLTKKLPWIVSTNTMVRVEIGMYRCLVLRYSVIKSMGLWTEPEFAPKEEKPVTYGPSRIAQWFPSKS